MQIRSPDGTPIAAHRSGDGPPLLMVHGVGASHTIWSHILPALAQQRTVYAVDRRGRGAAGDTQDYALEREIEDITALCAAIGEPLTLLGHGYGALIAMEAALRSGNVARMVLYEPWIIGYRVVKFGVAARLQASHDSGDHSALLSGYLSEVIHLAQDELEQWRAGPSWQHSLAAAPTVLRELSALQAYLFDAMPFRSLNTPTLLLLGGQSIPSAGRQVWIAHEALPNSRIVTMADQRHMAMLTAPDLFAREVLAFA